MKTQLQSESKGKKGTVSIENLEDRGLRLRWRCAGKRYVLALGIPDNKLNSATAQRKAKQIEGDMVTGNFDPTLKKYQPERTQTRTQLSVVSLFERFTTAKAKILTPRTIANYKGYLTHIQDFFGESSTASVGDVQVEKFTHWLATIHKNTRIQRERVALLRAAWTWAIEQELVEANPWTNAPLLVKVSPKQPPKPFSREEIGAIIQAFRADRYYCHYADYVEFLFGTGCRTGEAIGLRWGHLDEDCSQVWIGEQLTKGTRKATKTNRARVVTLTPKLTAMLLGRRPAAPNPEALVFASKEGGPIDDNNFRGRAWKTILTRLKIDYRKPYTTRHTLISHALDLGMNPVMVAQLTGHDVQTLYQNYAGNVSSKPKLPEL